MALAEDAESQHPVVKHVILQAPSSLLVLKLIGAVVGTGLLLACVGVGLGTSFGHDASKVSMQDVTEVGYLRMLAETRANTGSRTHGHPGRNVSRTQGRPGRNVSSRMQGPLGRCQGLDKEACNVKMVASIREKTCQGKSEAECTALVEKFQKAQTKSDLKKKLCNGKTQDECKALVKEALAKGEAPEAR